MTDTAKNTVSDELLTFTPSGDHGNCVISPENGTGAYFTLIGGGDDAEQNRLAEAICSAFNCLRASIPGGVGVKGLADAKKRMQEALDLHDAEVADQLASEGERADLWTDIDVLVDDLRVILAALDLSPAEGGPSWFAVQSVAGSHIGLWRDENIARRVFEQEYPNGALIPLYAAPYNPVISDEMVERMAEWMALDHVSVSDRAEYSWDATDAVWKDAWRKKAQTALEAALSVKPQSDK